MTLAPNRNPRVPRMTRTLILALCMTCLAPTAKAHEFWIEPEAHQVPAGSPVVATLRVGQKFKGASMSYLPPQFRRFDYVLRGETHPVPGVIGDRPAVNLGVEGEGLLVLVHETTDTVLDWDGWEDFESFVRHKDAVWTLDAHAARGFSRDDVRELYSRYAKSLVALGDGAGADAETGLVIEFVALETPFSGDMSDGLDVRLLYQGKARGDAQIEVFERAADDSVAVFTLRTDAAGEASVPVKPGHRYMIDAVVLREPDPAVAKSRQVHWESLWANLTFAVPAD